MCSLLIASAKCNLNTAPALFLHHVVCNFPDGCRSEGRSEGLYTQNQTLNAPGTRDSELLPRSGSPTGCYPAGCSRIQVQNFFLCSTWLSFKGCTVDTCTDKYTNIHVGSEMVAISKCPIKMKYTVLETMKLYHCMKLHDMTWHDAMSGLSPFLTAPLAVLLTSLPKTRRWTETNLPHAGIEPGMLGLRASHQWRTRGRGQWAMAPPFCLG